MGPKAGGGPYGTQGAGVVGGPRCAGGLTPARRLAQLRDDLESVCDPNRPLPETAPLADRLIELHDVLGQWYDPDGLVWKPFATRPPDPPPVPTAMRAVEIAEGGHYPKLAPGDWVVVYVRPTSGRVEHDRFVLLHQPLLGRRVQWGWMPCLSGYGPDFKREEW